MSKIKLNTSPLFYRDIDNADLIIRDQYGDGNGVQTFKDVNLVNHNVKSIILSDEPLSSPLVSGELMYNEGHLYFTSQGAQYAVSLANGVKTSTTTVSNTTTETEIYSKSFLAGELHADEVGEITLSGGYSNSSASDDYTLRFKLNGTTIYTVARVGGNVTDVGWQALYRFLVRTTGASGTMVDYVSLLDHDTTYAYAPASGTTSINTTASNTFSVTVQWTNATAGNVFACTQGYITLKH